ncbi:oxidoreductase FAD-binding domain protein [Mycobacterium xenopi 4042]|uniref:Oxidoreductase FAD-binding domain protein n=1 Tax=Mycobacterium xenopi 4042 TaxID=1299334 RepID=X8AF13_MYCXE|nr:oxidoreductase FAD-binding domain protein [Mycobacterium xenopi 4042]
MDGQELYRSYSMSSAPETDPELMTTVKRVPGARFPTGWSTTWPKVTSSL